MEKQAKQANVRITVKGRNVLVTEAMKAFAMEKASKIEKFSNRILNIVITMDIQKLEHRVSIVMNVDHIRIKSQACTNDMYASVELAISKLEKQFMRYKNRIQDHQAKGVNVIDMQVNVLNPKDYLTEINDAIEEQNQEEIVGQLRPHEVVSREKIPLKHLTVEEAIMKMELSSDAFMVYRSEEDRKLRVIYRRNDGNYGIFEPETN